MSFDNSTHARDFESAFCRDFYCCGLRLYDLHDLLQHYEECHVRFEDEKNEGSEDDSDDEMAGNESDELEEDSWSDEDSGPSSPSSTAVSGLSMCAGVQAGAGLGLGLAAATMNGNPLYNNTLQAHYCNVHFSAAQEKGMMHQGIAIHKMHPLYRHPSLSSSSSSDAETVIDGYDGLNAATKRKAAISLADIYAADHGGSYTKFQSGSLSELEPTNPLAKRHATESCQRSFQPSVFSDVNRPDFTRNPSKFTYETLRNSTPYHSIPRPLLTEHPPTSPYINAAVDLMRQREEVFSLMEDITRTSSSLSSGDKPYRCTIPGCDKSYKNPNGLKYHNLHGHCSVGGVSELDPPESRPYLCTFLECGKRYKNLNGLKYHIEHSHPNLTAALRAHQSGIYPLVFGPFPNQAAITIAAAVQAVNASPMMMAATNAIMTAQAINAANTANASASAETGETGATLAVPSVLAGSSFSG
ncbi:hypothetical protein BGZ54_002048 [Gamsiella multidivaricata]|nr:hypothetical protein BGZ54_002048 [Gamsiella multidivaricata]